MKLNYSTLHLGRNLRKDNIVVALIEDTTKANRQYINDDGDVQEEKEMLIDDIAAEYGLEGWGFYDKFKARRIKEFKDHVAKEMPGLEIDDKKVSYSLGESTVTYRLSNLEYLEYNYMYNYMLTKQTELNWHIEWAKEFKAKYGDNYALIETDSYVYIVSSWDTCLKKASVYKFYKFSGAKVPGERKRRAVGETSKGLYVVLGGKRYYPAEYLPKEEPVAEETAIAAVEVTEVTAVDVTPAKPGSIKLYRTDEGFYDLAREARAAVVMDSDYNRHDSEYVTIISQANGFVYTLVENIDLGTSYSVEKTPGVAVSMMITDKDDILGGDIVATKEQYRPDDGSLGYDIVVVVAPTLRGIIRNFDGGRYIPCRVDDNNVSMWEQLEGGK